MKPLLHPRLVNAPFGDPGLLVECLFERRNLLFDLGDLTPLSPRQILRVSHAFVSHAHMDHFAGFDQVLRICLGREKALHLFGPAGFIEQVGHKLAAYTWNLVSDAPVDFVVTVTEVRQGGAARAEYHSRDSFRYRKEEPVPLADGVLVDEDNLRVRCATLDHGIPCLAFAVEEKIHVNVWRDRLAELGLPVGPWLRDLKRAVLRGHPDDTPIHTPLGAQDLGPLRAKVLTASPGQKIAYVVDAAFLPANADRIVDLVRGADVLFIESPFLDQDAELALTRRHLTAAQAGHLAAMAGVKRLVPFHFSPRYKGQEERLATEAEAAFRATGAWQGAPDAVSPPPHNNT